MQSKSNRFAVGACLIGMVILMALAFYGKQCGVVYIKTSGNPAETVVSFYEAVLAGNYEQADTYLYDQVTMDWNLLQNQRENASDPLQEQHENTPIQLQEALLQSYSYKLVGEPLLQGRSAVQRIEFSFLDLERFSRHVEGRMLQLLRIYVQERPKDEVFGEADTYRPEFIQELYGEALEKSLPYAEQYRRTKEMELQLYYEDGTWYLLASDEIKEGLQGR